MTTPAGVPAAGAPVRLRGRTFGADHPVVMAIVNRTPDSFYAPARHSSSDAAVEAIAQAAGEGADIVDIGGIRAGRGPRVDAAEEVRRVVPLIALVRDRHPDLLISVDTWRADVARQAARAGADLINDTWAGHDPHLVEVAAEEGVGVVCSHTGGALPRTDPFRVAYPRAAPAGPDGDPGADPGADPRTDLRDGVVDDVLATLAIAAARAVSLGIDPGSVFVDPTHDFGKNTWHSLHLVRRTAALVGLGHPVLMALSRKDFVGESLDLPVDERLEGTLAATAVAAWLGARVFRTHDVRATRRTLDMVAAIRGDAPPARAVRGLA
ncbi:dihydropteroate synthase [Pengzhenrongella frigida]|uniref:Dihydropteroate synthase n=1 Tax=Pengzhenrongella frigida TaxID=1259133 RepID=A0A4Q5N3Y5_9MICO|nr:dihydropteroate synthase [Cellulomonas sp. HLT2-17]RYV51993.1 dihydropteroate synthase [Cellulomonas sp. HLT2-17]